ncbi:unannotated protein [freshwater metagenome]|uniref:Unannotated protein n=1 Tax=freshwater metagenome TaxID=449393 RepID=A0A6J6CVT2_9ZZZZ
MAIPANTVVFFANNKRGLGVNLEAHKAVDHMDPRFFQFLGPTDVLLFIEPSFEFNECSNLFAALGGTHKRLNNRSVR